MAPEFSRVAWFAAALLLALAAPVCAWMWPTLNWDMLAYIGIVKCWSLPDPSACHAAAYADVARFAHSHRLDAAYGNLLNGNEYRRALTADPEAFQQSFGFYRIRPLYVVMVAAIGRLTPDLATATLATSCTAVLVANLAVLRFAFARIAPIWAAVLGGTFALSPPLMTIAGLSTPDALVTAMATIGAIIWLGGRPVAGAAMLLLCVAVRNDFAATNGVVAGVLLVAQWRAAAGVPVAAITLLALSYPLALAVGFWGGGYSFATLYAHTFNGWLVHPAQMSAMPVSLHRMIAILCFGVATALGSGALLLPAVPAAALVAARPCVTPAAILAGGFVLASVFRTVVFPLVDMRLQAPIFAAVFVCFVTNSERTNKNFLF